MIGSGIFIVSADIARHVGSAGGLILTWVITGLLTVTAALSYGELAAMMPEAGGQYVYLREAFSPLWGFLYGWTLFLVIQTGTIVAASRGVKAEAKLAATTSALRPMRTPTTISRASDSVFAEVKMFWMIFPILRPRVLIQVRSAIIRTPTSCWRDRLIAYPDEMSIGGTIQEVGEIQGTSTPR